METINRRNSHWAEKRIPLLKDVKSLYESGNGIRNIGKRLGISDDMVISCLNDLSIPIRQCSEAIVFRKKSMKDVNLKKRKPFHSQIKILYEQGYSCKEISEKINRSRNFVNQCLKDMGIKPRTASEQNKIRMQKLTPDERKKLTKKAHKAKSILYRSPESARKYAIAQEKSPWKIGMFELDFIDKLESRGFSCKSEKAWKGYNFDIFIGDNIAVEIHSSPCRVHNTAGDFVKIMDACSSGINIIYIWMRPVRDVTDIAIDEIIKFIEECSLNPSPLGQYRVVRSNGQRDAVSERYIDHISDIISRYREIKSTIEN